MISDFIIPIPFAIAIDDLGWMQGYNEGYLGEGAYRIGLKRKMSIEDYYPLIEIAKHARVRLQGLFILGEMDRENEIYSHPTMVPPTKKWYNKTDDSQLEIMEFVKNNSDYLEFGLHGVGHEYWPNPNSNKFKRAEWYNLEDKAPWPEDRIRNHLDTFQNIMNQYGFSKSKNQSFPKSFVPCAYSYYWNPKPKYNEYSLGSILKEYGVQFANTDFTKIPESSPPIDGGFDSGIHVLNRYNFGNLWYMIGQLPTIPLKYQTTQFIETHWPNLLAQDTFLQQVVTDSWVNYYRAVNQEYNRYTSKNTAEHHSQFIYQKYCKVYITPKGEVIIDNSAMPTDVDHQKIIQSLVLKIRLPKGKHLTQILLNENPISAYYESEGFAFLYLPKLDSKKYELNFKESIELPDEIIWHDTTNNIFEKTDPSYSESIISGRFYGNQTITYLTRSHIEKVTSSNNLLEVVSWKHINKKLEINLRSADMQGVNAKVSIFKSSK